MPAQHSRRSIFIRPSIACLIILALIAIPARAQDAGQVLGLSVGYRTLKNSVSLSAEKKSEIEEIEALARKASNDGKYGDALRHYHHAMTILRGQTWTPARALGLALQLKAERLIFDPGDAVKLTVKQSFALEQAVVGKLAGKLVIARPQNNPPEEVAELRKLGEVEPNFMSAPFTLEARLPDLADGNYQLVFTLIPAAGDPIVKATTIRIARGLTARASVLNVRAAELAAKLEKENQADLRRALAPVEYTSVFISRVNSGDFPLQRADLDGVIANSEALLAQIAKGEHPLKTKRGDIHWAYLSMVDKSLQPYRIFVPSAYDAKKKYPLVVALHGMGGDENSYFTGYDNGIIKREAEARGYLVVCPKGRAPTSMYLGSAEQDVLDVIAEMKREYSIDEDRIYLTGHSMGGYGTWSIAVNHPQMFAAIAPFAGGGMPQTFAKIKAIAHVPEIVVHGNADPTVSVEESRRMVKAAEAAGAKVKYIEVEGGNHSNVVAPQMKNIFDWFDAHRRQSK